jgi:hypothetical protein
MSISRQTLRLVVPPVLALGLVALVAVRPVDAQDVQPSAASLASTGGRHAAPVGNVGVTVPAVAFTEKITLADGRVRTAVLVNVAEHEGTASIVGLPGCSATAKPGVALWLDCAYHGKSGPLTVTVTLKDGPRYTSTVVPSVG